VLKGHREERSVQGAARKSGRVAGRASVNVPEVASIKNLAVLENRW
jgi:hypothetical protein